MFRGLQIGEEEDILARPDAGNNHLPLARTIGTWHTLPMPDTAPSDPADHAAEFSRAWVDRFDEYCCIRMEQLGIPKDKNGAEDPYRGKAWRAFDPEERTGGSCLFGITANSGCLNPDLLKGKKGGRIWPKARLRDRIDAIIAHEWAEDQTLDHDEALKVAAKTELPVSDGARRILRSMGR